MSIRYLGHGRTNDRSSNRDASYDSPHDRVYGYHRRFDPRRPPDEREIEYDPPPRDSRTNVHAGVMVFGQPHWTEIVWDAATKRFKIQLFVRRIETDGGEGPAGPAGTVALTHASALKFMQAADLSAAMLAQAERRAR
jgi:hypothetical protein